MKNEMRYVHMKVKLFDSELKVMELLWQKGELTAKELSVLLKEEIGWNKNTTYTVIKKCIEKGAVERTEPNFLCKALISKKQVQEQETKEFINKLYDGSVNLLFASLLDKKKLSKEEIDNLKKMVDDLE